MSKPAVCLAKSARPRACSNQWEKSFTPSGGRRRASNIKSAFSKYVSPDVVEQMIAQPDKLRLGGERRELTLLFSDLKGFTSISEKLPPDGVANLINLYLRDCASHHRTLRMKWAS